MTNEEKEAFINEICTKVQETIQASVDERVSKIEAAQEELVKSVEEVKASAEEAGKAVDETIGEVKASIEEVKAAQESAKAEAEAEAEEQVVEAAKAEEKVEAEAEEIPMPKAGQHVEENPVLSAGDEKQKKLDEIKASTNMSLAEKIKEITKVRYAD